MAINPSSALRESGACRTALDAKVRSPTDLCIDNLVRGVLAKRKNRNHISRDASCFDE